MSLIPDKDDLDREGSGEVGFKRHLLVPGLVLTMAEVVLVVLPLWTLFDLGQIAPSVLLRIAIPVLAGVAIVWLAFMTAQLTPVQRAIQWRRRGERLPKDLATRAYEATLRAPIRMVLVRTALWVLTALSMGVFLVQYAGMAWPWVIEMTSLTAMHAFVVNVVRAVWYASILATVRGNLFASRAPIHRFADSYFGRLVLVAFVVSAGTMTAIAAFLYYLSPISLEQYLQIQTYFPSALAVGLVVWLLVARRLARELDDYLASEFEGDRDSGKEPTVTAVHKRAQSLPYRLALVGLSMWIGIIAVGAVVARVRLRFDLDDTVLMVGIFLLTALGGAIYASLWHRDTMRPLLAHLSVRHRVPVRAIRTSLSLRTKLLLSFGGVVLFACGLALLWGFVQYKNLVNDFVSRQAGLSLAWLRSEVKGKAGSGIKAPTHELVREVLEGIDERSPEAGAVFYYLPREAGKVVTAAGDKGKSVPTLPWYAIAKMSLERDGDIDLDASLGMAGRHGRLRVIWNGDTHDLGSVAVLYPDYRGHGKSAVRPLKELMIFFLVLFGACAGIVTLTVGQFVKPIRKLEQRADGMAQGELAEPVSSGAESDEIGRLTFALEEMRRALRDKLRSTEEVNLDLERAVQRRTADLAKKNRELAETLDKLTRTQDQLVRSEKMASIGQLVAGIAHEINNPVNAIVNTVGPLKEAIDFTSSEDPAEREEAAADVRDMIRVIQRGAQRTKDIVQALHNYSRTDDEKVVDFELNRALDDSLELLRHLLKQHIDVERDYADVGRIRGHAGQLNQVFMNLLTNAAQALSGQEGAIIRIETGVVDGGVVIHIRDNGPGIPPDVLPRIFDPFFTTKDVGEGTGLGLSIVHGLVERHGGAIEVDSKLGAGTTFTVTLPRSPEQALHAERSDTRP